MELYLNRMEYLLTSWTTQTSFGLEYFMMASVLALNIPHVRETLIRPASWADSAPFFKPRLQMGKRKRIM